MADQNINNDSVYFHDGESPIVSSSEDSGFSTSWNIYELENYERQTPEPPEEEWYNWFLERIFYRQQILLEMEHHLVVTETEAQMKKNFYAPAA